MEFVIDTRLQNKLARIDIFWDKKRCKGLGYSSSGTVFGVRVVITSSDQGHVRVNTK